MDSKQTHQRLASLDALRGMDLLMLVALDRVVFKLQPVINAG